MKKLTFSFTPPHRKIALLVLYSMICLNFPVYAESDDSLIDGFRGYEWGTALEDIQKQEVTSEMKEMTDYYIETELYSEYDALAIYGQSVDKYDADTQYIFTEECLIAGGYDMDVDDDNFGDIEAGITEKYGDPALEKESTGWGQCSLWIDEDGGCIALSEILGLIYFAPDSPFIEYIGDQFEEFHEIDIQHEIEKVGEGYVGY